MIELELTYLAKNIPEDLDISTGVEMIDLYIPKESLHPKLRIRKQGDKLMVTKKNPVVEGDASKQIEQTIQLESEEFNVLKQLPGKIIEKTRYKYKYKDRVAEVDVFGGNLKGLVVVDFEFDTEKEKDAFESPLFCLADITQDTFIAGGVLAGKNYLDIEPILTKYSYIKIE